MMPVDHYILTYLLHKLKLVGHLDGLYMSLGDGVKAVNV